jgi:hypothetical protein
LNPVRREEDPPFARTLLLGYVPPLPPHIEEEVGSGVG